MAVGLITSCSTLTTYNVDYSGTLLLGTIYYLTFVGNTIGNDNIEIDII